MPKSPEMQQPTSGQDAPLPPRVQSSRTPSVLGDGAREAWEHASGLESSLLLRDVLLATAMDGLKNPLFGLSLNASVLDRLPVGTPEVVPRHHACVSEIREALTQIHLALSALRGIKHFDAGDFVMDVRPHSTSDLAAIAVGVIVPVSQTRGVRVTTQVRPSASRLACDRARMIQALTALLWNAVRRTPTGGAVRLVASDTGLSMHLTVHDGGALLDEEGVAEILAAAVDPAQAQGPAMFMARRVIELHGGSLRARPDDAGGMVFDASLPLLSAER